MYVPPIRYLLQESQQYLDEMDGAVVKSAVSAVHKGIHTAGHVATLRHAEKFLTQNKSHPWHKSTALRSAMHKVLPQARSRQIVSGDNSRDNLTEKESILETLASYGYTSNNNYYAGEPHQPQPAGHPYHSVKPDFLWPKKRKKKKTTIKVYEENWMKNAVKRPGAFRAKAQAAGMSTSQFARAVLNNPDKYDTRTVRQANLAKTFAKFRKKKVEEAVAVRPMDHPTRRSSRHIVSRGFNTQRDSRGHTPLPPSYQAKKMRSLRTRLQGGRKVTSTRKQLFNALKSKRDLKRRVPV